MIASFSLEIILPHSSRQNLSGFSIQLEQDLIWMCVNSVVFSNVFGWLFLWPLIIFLHVYIDQYLMDDLMGEMCRCLELFIQSSHLCCSALKTSHFDFLKPSAPIRELLFQREITRLHLAYLALHPLSGQSLQAVNWCNSGIYLICFLFPLLLDVQGLEKHFFRGACVA